MAPLTEEQKAQRAAARRRSAAIAAEDALRQERKRQAWDANGTRLTRDEIEAGVACRGCGQPIIDGLGDWAPFMKLTEDEKREYDAAQADFATRHKDCRVTAGACRALAPCTAVTAALPRRSASGSWRGSARAPGKPTGPAELRTWRLILSCDHVIDVQQHKSHGQWTTNVRHCPTCKQTRGVVTAEAPQ